MVFLFSDFIDAGFEHSRRLAPRLHRCITDRWNTNYPGQVSFNLPILKRSSVLIDTSSANVRATFAQQAVERTALVRRAVQGAGAEFLDVRADGSHLDALARFLRLRNERRHRV